MNELLKSKKEYLDFKKDGVDFFGGLDEKIDNYINDLEKTNKEMLEWIIKRIKLEDQRIKLLHDRNKLNQIIAETEFHENDGIKIIEKATGMKIEEILK